MSSALQNLTGHGKSLTAEPPDAREFEGLVRRGLTRLGDVGNKSMSLEGRFDAAYQGAHSLSLAALRYRGYRPVNRYIVFQVLPHTLGLGPEVWRVLAKAHKWRNRAEYEGDLDIDERFVAELISAARKVADAVRRCRRCVEEVTLHLCALPV